MRSGVAGGPGLRVAASYLLLFAIALLLAVVPVRRALLQDADDEIAAELEHAVEDLRAELATIPADEDLDPADATAAGLTDFVTRAVPGDGEVLIAIQDGLVLAAVPEAISDRLVTPARIGEWSSVVDAEWGDLDDAIGQFRWLTVRVGQRSTFVAAIDVGPKRAAATDLVEITMVASACALLAGGALAWVMSRRDDRPGEVPQRDITETGPVGGAATGRFKLVDAAELTDELVSEVRARHRQRRWQLASTADGDLVCDPERIQQAVMMLADNAVQHTSTGDAIAVSSRNDDGGVSFSVADQSPDSGARRCDEVVNPVTKVVVAAHEGRFSMEADGHDGAVFSFFVPRRPLGGSPPGLDHEHSQ